ncbi:hypothetical protein C6V80_09590 [Caminibacter pacificus]|uniref:Uncharacterized protein n=1 Tax=Caminibacter pacificus TaxID=1424653 RepID=A0ABX5VWA8_9BACT|nr:hypothetical protein [Caminibacter pacificus]QDD68091.1 hypothetical protein C6V80_09590 [Caminibacter pacificus]
MEITISNLQNRFNFFSYSAFQKYKNDKCENKPFFSCKKDFYLYLENMYILEYNSRKKLFEGLNEIDFLILSLVLNEEDINDLSNFSSRIVNRLLEEEYISIFNTNNFSIGEKISDNQKLSLALQISNKLNNIKFKNEWSKFDEFTLFQILNNLKRFSSICDYYCNTFDISNISENTLIIFPNNKDVKIKLFFKFRNNKFEIYEEENINNKVVKTKLKEPKWISKFNSEKYSYMDS